MKLESQITAELMKQERMPVGAWEVKRTTGKSLPFCKFAQHQIEYLLKAKTRVLSIKIRDVGKAKKEFDGVTFYKSPSSCICCYPAKNKDGYHAYSIDIEVWYQERRTCGRKSLTEKRASELGYQL